MNLPERVIRIWDADLTRLLLVCLSIALAAGWIASGAIGNWGDLSQPTATLVAGLAAAIGSTLIGALALLFAWRSTQATMRQQVLLADRREVSKVEAAVHEEIAEWLGKHPLLGEGEIFYEHDPFATYTSIPGQKLLARAQLFADNSIWEPFVALRQIGYLENEYARAAKLIMGGLDRMAFADSSIASVLRWEGPADAHRELTALRTRWIAARTELQQSLRTVARRAFAE